MARQTFYLDRAVRHPLYKTRMLQAGPIELDAGAARLYRQLGVNLLDEAPKRAGPTVSTVEDVRVVVRAEKDAPKPAAKRAPAKRKARKMAKPGDPPPTKKG